MQNSRYPSIMNLRTKFHKKIFDRKSYIFFDLWLVKKRFYLEDLIAKILKNPIIITIDTIITK